MDLTTLLASQITGYEAHSPQFSFNQLKKITYVTASNGLFRVEKTHVAVFKTKIKEFEHPVPGLLPMEEGAELLIPKIPFEYLQMALSFYRDVYDRDKTEASLLFFWNKDLKNLPKKYTDGSEVKGLLEDGALVIYVPRQVNSGGLSEFHADPMVNYLRENCTVLAETHSHGHMNAFFSGTDNANENMAQFYGVWGKVCESIPQFAFRYVTGNAKVEISPDVLFDWPKIQTIKTIDVTSNVEGFKSHQYQEIEESLYQGPFAFTWYPDDWIHQHSKKQGISIIDRPFNKNKHTTSIPTTYFPEEYFEDSWSPNFYQHHEESIPRHFQSMGDAEIIQFLRSSDEPNKLDIQDNILDIMAEYSIAGYARVMEEAIDQLKS